MAGKRRLDDRNAQRGAALIVSMVMLVVITLIGVVAMNGSRLEWLMTNNSQFQSGAYRNATVALQAGLADPAIPATAPNPPPIDITTLSPSNLTDVTKWRDGTLTPTPDPCTDSCYIVEYLGCSVFTSSGTGNPPVPSTNPCNGPSDITIHTYRVWAYGSDGKGAARILQATVRRTLAVAAPPNMKGTPANNWVEIP